VRPGSNENLDPPLSAHVLAMQVGVAPSKSNGPNFGHFVYVKPLSVTPRIHLSNHLAIKPWQFSPLLQHNTPLSPILIHNRTPSHSAPVAYCPLQPQQCWLDHHITPFMAVAEMQIFLWGLLRYLSCWIWKKRSVISPSFAGDTLALNASSAQEILWRGCFISWAAML
jgi:hypothetical protein